MTDIQLPALGESVTEGTITRWLKAVGDEVAVDEPIVEVSTDKVDTEVPSPVAGTLTEILAEEDDTVDVGAVIARIGDAGDAPAQDAPAEEAPAAEAATAGTDSEADQEADDESAAEAQDSPSQQADAAQASQQQADPVAQAQDTDQAEISPTETQEAGTKPSGGGAEITLPALGESVTEGTITRWLKAVGDTVEVDEPIVEVSTDKVDTEVPSPVAGTITEILANEDDTVDVGAVIARIGDAGSEPAPAPAADEPSEQASGAQPVPAEDDVIPGAGTEEVGVEQEEIAKEAIAEEAPKQEAPKQEAPKQEAPKQAPAAPSQPKAPAAPAPKAAPAAPAPSAAPSAPTGGSPYVTPIVRKLANEKGVDLASLTGTGVGGRIRKEDVLAAAESAAQAPAAEAAPSQAPAEVEVSPLRGTTAPMSRLRKVVAKRAVESMQTLAQLTTVVEVDVTKVAQLREAKKAAFQQETGSKLTFLPFFTQAAVQALKSHPLINSTDDGEQITYPATENLAMAVDTERGLLTPVIRDASSKSIRELTAEIADLAQRTRDNKLSPDELAGGTFTLTNTGSRGALFDTPVVFQPQRAILGVGTVVKRPVVVSVDGQDSIAIRSMVYLALSYDHRIIDGADAARYLGQVKARLESGAFEV
ncbi:2-oxoglutarate dehydrogenase, E2 component, dihydrolipoamide succinyltransferase [Agrococcus jenensis]|uniref:Dihydrolipoamide acetyltransferase component of pyruvate dehydrogenase complex n=1 Tax=Agrococcus jenensis TaxID=46353 RepID=A0A3N2AVU3_9MICO|nr:2-oxoglutarate dehydrogenase, E2 component, dihydrolipoamide succinyltransferase [Agrococcus jenensis]ROR67149.1 2-oxoglutarate dehydrogenase E2 component [Agrococcus jenensis]